MVKIEVGELKLLRIRSKSHADKRDKSHAFIYDYYFNDHCSFIIVMGIITLNLYTILCDIEES